MHSYKPKRYTNAAASHADMPHVGEDLAFQTCLGCKRRRVNRHHFRHNSNLRPVLRKWRARAVMQIIFQLGLQMKRPQVTPDGLTFSVWAVIYSLELLLVARSLRKSGVSIQYP